MMQPSLLNRLIRKLDKTLASAFFIDQWIILTGRDLDYRSLRWDAFKPLTPEKDRYWGDPFVLERGGRYFIFVEEKVYATGRGHIACLELDSSGNLISHQMVLERDHHLSYPFIFEHGDGTYMVPESAASGSVDLYRCVHFPDSWEFAHSLLRDTYAVDATLLEYEGRTWLFANIKEDRGSSLNALHLFWADDPLSRTWHPHPANPVVRDIGSARPAGRIFMHDGDLIRPSQDSSRRYGGALRFNRILRLDAGAYSEEPIAGFAPVGAKIRATHTFNQAGGMTVIDAVVRRPR
jgi:hypothetical protein